MTSPAPHRTGPAVLAMSDFGDEGCGVGSSESAALEGLDVPVRVLDPLASTWQGFLDAARIALDGAPGAVLVYPTLSQVARPELLARVVALRSLLGRRRWLRLHLHEFDRLDRRQRSAVAALLGLVVDRVVVSSAGEVAALGRRYGGWGARRAEVLVIPPANPSAPTDEELAAVAVAPVAPGTVGVHGQYRPDKGIDWLLPTLKRLDPRFERLEIAGRGWAAAPWPRSVLERIEVVDLGQTSRADLPTVLARWELALAPFDGPPTDGRNSLRTPLAFGVPTLTRGPRPRGMRLAPSHLFFDDEVDLGALPVLGPAERREGAAQVQVLEAAVRAELAAALYG